MKKKMQ